VAQTNICNMCYTYRQTVQAKRILSGYSWRNLCATLADIVTEKSQRPLFTFASSRRRDAARRARSRGGFAVRRDGLAAATAKRRAIVRGDN
jgi:hypothetical protein